MSTFSLVTNRLWHQTRRVVMAARGVAREPDTVVYTALSPPDRTTNADVDAAVEGGVESHGREAT